jgi:hypothetical protein
MKNGVYISLFLVFFITVNVFIGIVDPMGMDLEGMRTMNGDRTNNEKPPGRTENNGKKNDIVSQIDNPSQGKDEAGTGYDPTSGGYKRQLYNIDEGEDLDEDEWKMKRKSIERGSKYEDKKWWKKRCLYDFIDPKFLIMEVRDFLYINLKKIKLHVLVFILELAFWCIRAPVWIIYMLIKHLLFPAALLAYIYMLITIIYIAWFVHTFLKIPGNLIHLFVFFLYSLFFAIKHLLPSLEWPGFIAPIKNMFSEIVIDLFWNKTFRCTCFNGNCRTPVKNNNSNFIEYFIGNDKEFPPFPSRDFEW